MGEFCSPSYLGHGIGRGPAGTVTRRADVNRIGTCRDGGNSGVGRAGRSKEFERSCS